MMAFMKIVLLGVNDLFLSKLENTLSTAGFDCERLVSQKKMMDFVTQAAIREFTGVMVLGVGVSGKFRSSLMGRIRDEGLCFPVLSIVQAEAFEAIVEGQVSGVSDYVCLPVRSRELVTRVGILIRLAYPEIFEEQTLRYGPYVFSRYPDRVSFRGHEIPLTTKEYHLGRLFFGHIGKPLSRMTLSEAVWDSEEDESSRTIDTHVSRVRNKLGLNEKNGFSLKQVYGFGYQLTAV